MRRTRRECEQAVIDYIRKNPVATVDEIESYLRLNIHRIFGGIEQAFEKAGVNYPRKPIEEDVGAKIKEDLQKNPLTTIEEIEKKYHISFYKRYGSFRRFCGKFKVKNFTRHEKRSLKIQNRIIKYIQNHPNATQWQINRDCNTHVQIMFSGGIIGAYKKADIEYPMSRRKFFGAANKTIRKRALDFENYVFGKLEKFGNVEKYVETKNGILDATLQMKHKKIAVEIKNYLSKPVSKPEREQLLRYMRALNLKNGLLVCSQKTKKGFVKIGNYEIRIVTPEEMGSWSSLV